MSTNKQENKNIIKATCAVERIIFYKNEWGIIECSIVKHKEGEIKNRSRYNTVIFKGVMPRLKEGSIYNIMAEYVEDPKYGGQYNILSIFSSIEFGEDSKEGQKKFISSLFIPSQVERMYETIEDPFKALKEKNVNDLIKIKGCGLKTAKHWIAKFHKHLDEAKIYAELIDYNLTSNMIGKLMERYNSPDLVVEKVKNNPYVLCTDVKGIGWRTADAIALKGGIKEYSIERISAYIIHYLDMVGENGCSWITPDELMGAIIEELGEAVPDERITECIHGLGDRLWWDDKKTKIGLRKYFDIEEKIAKELIRIRDAETHITYKDWEDCIARLERNQGWFYTDEQKNGVKTILDNNIAIIQGLAGTGKTTLVSAMIEVLKSYDYVQCALSGRASSRMAEVTGKEGYTIHRLLGFPHGEKQGFTFHDGNPLPYDIYILDEISMVDAFLLYYLLRAIPDGAKLICLGDPGQLEAIGAGNIAHDMISANEIPTVTLTKIHRQASKSAIITESIKVRNGQQIINKDWAGEITLGELQDLHIKAYSDKTNTFYEIVKSFTEYMEKDDFDILETQVIVPIKNNGAACTYEINNIIQELYNPEDKNKKEHVTFNNGKSYILREGDKIINVANNYKTEPPIYNGNIGIIDSIKYDEENDEEVMIINFNEIGEVIVPKTSWRSIELGYAITCHKSQGSQFKNVILGLDFTSYSLLNRELVYTGITRAKKKCNLIAQTGALRMAINKESVSKKQTHLQQCLYDVTHPKLIF